MSLSRKILLALLIVFVLLQFIPRSENKSDKIMPADITRTFTVPDNIINILQRACYDCHSNNTRYPWYSSVQPFRRFLDNHIRDGKKELNFSDFGSYTRKRQYNKLKAIEVSLQKETMPLKSYKLMHAKARLTESEKDSVIRWVNEIRSSMETEQTTGL